MPQGGRTPPSTGPTSTGGVTVSGTFPSGSVTSVGGCVVSPGVVASTMSSVLPSGVMSVAQTGTPARVTQSSPAPHAGLQADTQVPDTQAKPSRHAGVQLAVPDEPPSLHAENATALTKTAARSHPKDEGLMHNGYHAPRGDVKMCAAMTPHAHLP